MKNYSILILALFLVIVSNIFGQSLLFRNVDQKKYPIISAEFKADDAGGKRIETFDLAKDLKLFDNGVQRNILNVSCPANVPRFSLILVLDITQSMIQNKLPDGHTRLEASLYAATQLVSQLANSNFAGRCECAIITFSGQSTLKCDFVEITKANSDVDVKVLQDSINTISVQGTTKYHEAWLGQAPLSKDKYGRACGAAYVGQRAKYRPIFIFLTDGIPDEGSLFNNDIPTILNIVGKYTDQFGVKMPGVIFGTTVGLNCDQTPIPNMTAPTGGTCFDQINKQEDIATAYFDILDKAGSMGSPSPCTITWQTDCSGGGPSRLDVMLNNTSATFTYDASTYKPGVQFTPSEVFFLNPKMPSQDTIITIKALTNIVNFTNITFGNGKFKLSGLPASLAKDASAQVTLTYSPADQSSQTTTTVVNSSACSGSLLTYGGFLVLKDVDMGSSGLTKKKSQNVQTLCNQTPVDITITDFHHDFNQKGDFVINTNINGRVIKAGECINIDYDFTPSDTGLRQATLIITTSTGRVFKSTISGNGTGKPVIQTVASIAFTNNDCITATHDVVVTIQNVGGVDMNVTDFSITPNTTDFDFKGGTKPAGFVVTAGGAQNITLTFKSNTMGAKTATLNIMSNASNAATQSIPLSGTVETVAFSTDVTNIDLGNICPGVQKDSSFTITNTGNVAFAVNNTKTKPEFTITDNTVNVATPGSGKVNFSFKSAADGTYNDVITIKDSKCNVLKTVNITAKVVTPLVSSADKFGISGAVGVPSTFTMTITNNTPFTLKGILITFDDAQFKVSAPYDKAFDMAPGASFDITITYLATSATPANAKIIFNGTPCTFSNSYRLTSSPVDAKAKISIANNYSGMIGQTIPVQVNLEKTTLIESGAKLVNTKVIFDGTLLQQNGTVYPEIGTNSKTVTLTSSPLTNNNNEILATLNFKVLNSASSSSPLTVQNSSVDKGVVTFTEQSGLFTLIKASAQVGFPTDLKAAPGQAFDLPLNFTNIANVDPFHKAFDLTIKFNASLIEPVEDTPAGTVDHVSGMRTIKITGIPISQSKTQIALKTFKMRAMLGNAMTTDISFESMASQTGYVDFQRKDAGKFTLLGVLNANTSNPRLYDPFGTSGIIRITPNPANDYAEISYNLRADENVKFSISDMLGNKIKDVSDQDCKAGEGTVGLSTEGLTSGSYILIMQTATQRFSMPLNLIK
ncbi:MAG: choice-of-anchor D domain-containing protein [Candidatus Kapabacteria bacterium]|nr:choice-of-anchor D domain-containing protein [Candidatus Kapabacteria bacterium]